MEQQTQQKKIIIPARMILRVMGILALFGLPKRLRMLHLVANRIAWENYQNEHLTESAKKLPFIENQDSLADFQYGRNVGWLSRRLISGRKLCGRENACEVIAVYNALLALTPESLPDLPELLAHFESRGVSLGGYFGTSFGAVMKYFGKRNLSPQVLKSKKITPEAMEEGESSGKTVCVMMAENSAGQIRDMVHTICITKDAEGWMAHNDYEGSKHYPGLKEAVFGYRNGKSRPLGVILM